MALAIDSQMPSNAGFGALNVDTDSQNFNNAGGGLMIAGVAWGQTNGAAWGVSGVNYNGVAMTLFAHIEYDGAGHNAAGVSLYYLLNPATGTHALQVNMLTGTITPRSFEYGAITYTGHDTTTPIVAGSNQTNSRESNATTATVNSATTALGNMAVALMATGNSYVSTSQTLSWSNNFSTGSAGGAGAMTYASGTGGVINFSNVIGSDFMGMCCLEIAAAATGGPEVTSDFPNPIAPARTAGQRDFTGSVRLSLIGKDKFFGLAGNPNNDWPNPVLLRFPTDLRTFTNAAEIHLIGQDKFFGAAGERTPVDQPNPVLPRRIDLTHVAGLLQTTLGVVVKPFSLSDWPNPGRRVPAVDLYTFINATEQQLVGKDQFFGAPGEAPRYDYPNPLIRANNPSLHAWVNNAVASGMVAPPFIAVHIQNPLVAPFPVALRTSTFYYVVDDSVPFVNSDWPNPRGYTPAIELRTFINAVEQQLIGKDVMFGAPGEVQDYDWPNPATKGLPVGARTWLVNLLEGTLGIIAPMPFNLGDQPNPQSRSLPITLRTHTDPTKLHLIGKDQMFGAPGQVPQYEFPNPISAKQLRDMNAVMVNLLENTLGIIVPAPFSMLDWPNPLGRTPAIELRTFLDELKLNLQGKDKFFGGAGQPPANMDWPNPRGYTYPIVCRVHIGPVALNLIGTEIPALNFDQPNPLGRQFPVGGRSITHSGVGYLGKDQFYGLGGPQYDYPNPQIARQPIVLKVWLDPTKIHLIGKDKFFGGPGQAPANYDQPNPLIARKPVDLKWLMNNLLENTLGIVARQFQVAMIGNEYYVVTEITTDSVTFTGINDDSALESQ